MLDPLNLLGGFATQPVKMGSKAAKVAKRTKALTGSAKAAEEAEGVVGAVARGAKETIKTRLDDLFKPKTSERFDEFIDIAKKEGMDEKLMSEVLLLEKDSTGRRMQRAIAQMPGGQKRADEFNDAIDNISNATKKAVDKIGGGTTLTPVEAGKTIRDGIDNAALREIGSNANTYSGIAKDNPAIFFEAGDVKRLMKKFDNFAASARRNLQSNDPTKVKQAQQVLEVIESTKGSFDNIDDFVFRMQDVGGLAFEKKFIPGETPADVKSMRRMYDIMRDEFFTKVGNQQTLNIAGEPMSGKEVVKQLKQNNERISNFLQNKKKIGKNLLKGDDAALFNSLVNDSEKINALKEILSPEEFQKLKGAFLDSKLKYNQDGDLLFRSSWNTLKGAEKKKGVMSSILSPEEQRRVGDLLDMGDALGGKVNPSGTAEMTAFSKIKDSIQSVIVNEALLDVIKRRAKGAKMSAKDVDLVGSIITTREAKDILEAANKADNLDSLTPQKLRRITGALSGIGAKGRVEKLPLKKVQLGKGRRQMKTRPTLKGLQMTGARKEDERRQKRP